MFVILCGDYFNSFFFLDFQIFCCSKDFVRYEYVRTFVTGVSLDTSKILLSHENGEKVVDDIFGKHFCLHRIQIRRLTRHEK